MKHCEPLPPDDAAAQALLVGRKIVMSVVGEEEDDSERRRALATAAQAAISDYFGSVGGEPEYAKRNAGPGEIGRLDEFVCWCAFSSEAGPVLVALDAQTTLAAAASGLGKQVAPGADGAVAGIDRFLAAVLAKRLANALAPLAGGADAGQVGDRLALASASSEIRIEELNGRLDIFEFSGLTIADGVGLRFLIALPQLQPASSTDALSPAEAAERAAISARVTRHALAVSVTVAARKKFACMPFSAAAMLAPGDMLKCTDESEKIGIVVIASNIARKIGDAIIGQVDDHRAVKLLESPSVAGGREARGPFAPKIVALRQEAARGPT